jgi:uncharacterized integral membrane protein
MAAMIRFIRLLFVVPVAVAVIVLAVVNRGPLTLRYLPPQLGEATFTVPAFVALLGAVMLGVLIGGSASWWIQGRHRQLERTYRREAENLKMEAERLRAMQPAPAALALPAVKR